MCSWDEDDVGERVAPDEATLMRARLLEARMGGDHVPEKAWVVFSGKSSGAITWPHYQRLQASYDAAAALEKGFAHMRRERQMLRKLKCDAMT